MSAAHPGGPNLRGTSHVIEPEGLSDEADVFIDFEALEDYQPDLDDPGWHRSQIQAALKAAGIWGVVIPTNDYKALENVMLVAGRDTYNSDTRFVAGPVGRRYHCDGDCC